MKLLLDTHALLWWFGGDGRLRPYAKGLIEDRDNEILISVVTLWEIAIKVRVGKLRAVLPDVWEAIGLAGFRLVGIEIEHLFRLQSLPMHHRDPFDQLLIAQAMAEHAVLLSEDRYAALYPVRVVRCSDPALH